MENPFLIRVPRTGNSRIVRLRNLVEPFCVEHMTGWAEAIESHSAPNDQRVRAATLMYIAGAAARQCDHIGRVIRHRAMFGLAGEAALQNSTLNAHITSFTRQMIHRSLQVYPRLIGTRLVSVQPLMEPSGFVFYLKHVARDTGQAGDGRSLADLSQFDKTYGDRSAEGEQVKAVGTTLEKELVEARYKALMHQHSHEVDVAVRSQYGMDLEAIGDQVSADELAWEVDRQIVDEVTAFAMTNARGIAYFDPTYNGNINTLTPSERKEYFKQFMSRVVQGVKIEMAQDTFRQPNWYIMGMNVAKLLAETPEYVATPSGGGNLPDMNMTGGTIIQSGSFRDGGIILFDPQLDPDTMVCGVVDNMNPFWAGFAFLPFGAASTLTPLFYDPDILMKKKARALAFATKGINNKQYRVIKLGTPS